MSYRATRSELSSSHLAGDPSGWGPKSAWPEPDGGRREEAGKENIIIILMRMAVITLLRAHATCSQVQSTNSKGGPDARVTFETFLPLLQVIVIFDFSTWGLPGFEPGSISLAKQNACKFCVSHSVFFTASLCMEVVQSLSTFTLITLWVEPV